MTGAPVNVEQVRREGLDLKACRYASLWRIRDNDQGAVTSLCGVQQPSSRSSQGGRIDENDERKSATTSQLLGTPCGTPSP